MKEFEFVFSEGLFKGLKNGNENPMDTEVLDSCFNLEPTANGVVPHQYVVDLRTLGAEDSEYEHPEVTELGEDFSGGSGDWTNCWPWPQIRQLDNGTLLGLSRIDDTDNLGIYSLSNNSNTLTAVEQVSVGPIADIVGVDITEFFGFFLIGVHYIDNTVGSWLRGLESDYIDPVDMSNMPEFITSCIYNGQVLLGGLSAGEGSTWDSLGLSSILWSRPGALEFNPATDRSAGWIPQIDCGGTVVKLHTLQKSVVAFSTNGICMLVPTEKGWASHDLNKVGVVSCRHVAGTKNYCVYIDNNFELWSIDGTGKFTKLGYKQLLRPDNLSVYYEELLKWNLSVDRGAGRFYISNGVEGYVFNGTSMYQSHQCISSVRQFRDGGLGGIVVDVGDYSGHIVTGVQDFKQVGLKTVGFVELGGMFYPLDGDNDTTTSVGVDYSYDMKTLVDGEYKLTGPEGASYIGVTGSRFRLKFKVSNYRDQEMALRYLKARIKVSDKRTIRGVQNASYVGA